MTGESGVGREGHFLGLVGLWLVLCWGRFVLFSNEPVYLIGPLRVLEPEVLAVDWNLGGSPLDSTAVLFRVLVAPVWAVFEEPLYVAWVVRAACWTSAVLALRSLGHAAAMAPAALWLGLLAYLSTSPDLAASEWIFSGGEQKVFAYASLLAALAALIRGQAIAAGALAGLAVAFHVLVGGWGGLALGFAALCDRKRLGIGGLVRFAVPAGLLAVPALGIALAYVWSPISPTAPGPTSAGASAILVELRNPHHLDPSFFLTLRHLWELPLVVGGALWAVQLLPAAPARRIVTAFLAAVIAIFCSGLLAHLAGATTWTMLYPFRVGDVLLPLWFWIGVPTLVHQLWRGALSELPARFGRRVSAALAIASAILFVSQFQLYRNIRETLESWQPEARAAREERRAVWHRIRRETPEDAVFAAPPCEPRFWLEARRARVVGWKAAPSNARSFEWLQRMRALNGGHDLVARGSGACRETDGRFSTLDGAALAGLRDRFGATHYLVRRERPELAAHLLFEESGGFVYQLDRIEGNGGGH